MTEAMASMDVTAALQAAVEAAAEIARVGMPGTMMVFPTTAPENSSAQIPLAPAPPVDHEPNPHSINQNIPAAVPTSNFDTNSVSVANAAPSPTALAVSPFSDQGIGQDAAEQRGFQQLKNNDTGFVAVANHGAIATADAAGEKSFEESEEDAAKRLARSRERNREHARRTRLRKKAQLENLQQKVRLLEAEKKALKQKIEDCSIASILINLAEPSAEEQQQQDDTTTLLDDTIKKQQENSTANDVKIQLLTAGKRKRFASVDTTPEENRPTQALRLQIDGQTKIIGPKSHVNWKSGVFSDEDGVQRQLTAEQLESLRRERNRMHAKMTRDRKKNFIATIEKTIEELERDCRKMRDVLNRVGAHEAATAAAAAAVATPAPVTPLEQSPKISAVSFTNSAEKSEKELSPGMMVQGATAAPAVSIPAPALPIAVSAVSIPAPALPTAAPEVSVPEPSLGSATMSNPVPVLAAPTAKAALPAASTPAPAVKTPSATPAPAATAAVASLPFSFGVPFKHTPTPSHEKLMSPPKRAKVSHGFSL